MNLNQVTVPALDVAASVAFYRRLGLVQIVDAPHYARFECPAADSTFSVHRADHAAEPGVVVYFELEDLDRRCRELAAAGIAFDQEPRDEPWLGREARLGDPSGNVICLYGAGETRKNPPGRTAADVSPAS